MNTLEIYAGSDGEATKRFYAELEKLGPLGQVAANLFRAEKCSTRAKKYRGGIRGMGSFRGMAYSRKRWAMENLVGILGTHAQALQIRFGWKIDPQQSLNRWVLYVDLPQGQVSFHSPTRMAGPDYSGDWDGQRLSAERIIAFCDSVLRQGAAEDAGLFDLQMDVSSCEVPA